MKKPTVVDIFCGIGGVSKGFEIAGFDSVVGIDNWDVAIDTFTEEKIEDSTINDTMGKVRTRVMAKSEELLTESGDGLKVKITLKDGRVFAHVTARADILGSQKNPWGMEAIKEKFQVNVSRVLSHDGTAKAMATWENIPEMTDIAGAIRSTLVAENV